MFPGVNLWHKFLQRFHFFWLDAATEMFIDHNKEAWKNCKVRHSNSEILVEFYGIFETIISFSYFSNILAKKFDCKIKSFSISPHNSLLYRIFHRKMWSIYKSFNVTEFETSRIPKIKKLSAFDRDVVEEALMQVNSKEKLKSFALFGIPIGNDIYEGYLIERKQPTVDIESIVFKDYLRDCIILFLHWKSYFERNNVKAVILSHGIYRYGIISRIAISKNIAVYLPNLRSYCYLSKMEEVAGVCFKFYREIFQSLTIEEQISGIQWAKDRLEERFKGTVGVDMPYSEASAFHQRKFEGGRLLKESGKHKILITSHCFFDNPNAYGENLFSDFFEWLTFLGETANKTDFEWYLKAHPDVLDGNQEVLNQILAKFPIICQLPHSASFHQLVKEGISTVLTVYGSVGHELPLMGVKVINAGMNPHIAYNFNLHPRCIDEYKEMILDSAKLENKIGIDPNQVYEFYYVHHKKLFIDDLFVDSYAEFSSLPPKANCPKKAFDYFIRNLEDSKHRLICKEASAFIDSKEFVYFRNKG